MRIDVALAPQDALPPSAVVVVLDVVRATTTALYALRQGYDAVVCCGEVDDARAAAAELGRGAILAGERDCVPIEGFALGNSPREFEDGLPLGDLLVLTTTNGTRAVLQAQREAPSVLIGALVNLSACAAEAARRARAARGAVGIRCAGVRGAVALDDAYAAGLLVDDLAAYLPEWHVGDAAQLARAGAAGFASPRQALAASQSGLDLEAVGLSDDLRVCARADAFDLVAAARPDGERRARLAALAAA